MTPVFRHITVPVDGSTSSQRGVTFAIELARDGGRLSFCSVVDAAAVLAPAAHGVAVDPGPLLEVLDEDAAIFCGNAHDDAAAHGLESDCRVLHGSCIAEIDEFAGCNGSDAIVVGTHGRTGLSRAILGSIAEGLIRRADLPVVSVHEDDEMRTGPIAVAIDDSPAAQAALEVAIGMAGARAMALQLIHVFDGAPNSLPINTVLEAATKYARACGVAAELAVHEGLPAGELLRAIDAHECCMIVMGTHGRSAIGRLVLGSVAAAVVERARIPVVTVRCA